MEMYNKNVMKHTKNVVGYCNAKEGVNYFH